MLNSWSIHRGWLLLDSCLTTSWSIEILLHALFFTCFASFYYLVSLHSCIYMDSLFPLDHLYISRVKLSSFLYTLSIMTKRGRNRGESVVFFFKILHRGRNTCLCKGEMYFILLGGELTSFFLYIGLVTMFTYIVLIFDIYIYVCFLHLPLYVLFFFLSLYTYFFIVCNLLFLFHTKMPWWVLFKVFQKYGLSKSTCHKLSSCKVFQEFVLGHILLYSTSEYGLSVLWLLSYVHLIVVVLLQIAKGGYC